MSAEDRFDELGKALATSTSRRRFLKVAAAAAAAGVLSAVRAPIAAASHNRQCRDAGQNCTSNAQCCTHFCGTDFHCACAVQCPGATNGITTDCCEPGDVCCPGNGSTVPAQCIASSQTLCSGGRIFNANSCQCECPAGTTLCNNQCVQVCTPPKILNANCQCVCPSGTTACGGTCCPSGTQCVNGICQNVTTCGPSNCVGCCQSNMCLPGNTSGACGTGGATCATCTSPNVCCGPPSLGQCKRPSGTACTGNGQCCSNNCLPPALPGGPRVCA